MVLKAANDDKKLSEIASINADTEDIFSNNMNLVNSSRPIRNAVVLSFAYFFIYTGFISLSNLQSTMNAQQGMGVDSQAVIYLCSMVSCFFPELFIEIFGTKTTYVITLFLSVPYIAANFSPRWDTMMVSSVLFGLVSGPMNTALNCYLDEMAVRYASFQDRNLEKVTACFFGLYIFFSELTQVVGNGVSYILLAGHNPTFQNHSVQTNCGVHFDQKAGEDANDSMFTISDNDRYLLVGIFSLLSLLGAVTAFLLDPLGNDVKQIKGCRSVTQRIVSAVRHLKVLHQVLLLPLTIFIGVENSFYTSTVTQVSYDLFFRTNFVSGHFTHQRISLQLNNLPLTAEILRPTGSYMYFVH